MSWKPTIVVLLLATLGVVIAVTLWRSDQSSGGTITGPTLLLSADRLPIDNVQTITLRRTNEQALVFERGDQGWQQSKPFAHPMDIFSIRQLLVQTARVEVTERLSPQQLQGGRSEAALGLDPPQAELTLQWPEGAVTLQFGRRGVAGRWYVRIAGFEHVYVATGDLHDRVVGMDPKEWRERTLFAGADVDAETITIQRGGERTVLQKVRKQWRMTEPARTRIAELAQDEFFQALGRARSAGFILDQPDDLAQFGLDEPVGSLEVVTSKLQSNAGELERVKTTQRLLVGARRGIGSEDRFGMIEGRPVIFQLSEAVLGELFRKSLSLVALTASGVVPTDVKTLIIRSGQGELRLVRDLDEWRAPQFAVNVPAESVNELLQQLTNLRAPQIKIQDYPFELQVATITMRGFDNKPIDTVRIAREADTGRWILENGDNVWRIFPESLHLLLTPSDFGLQPSPDDTP